VESVEPAVVTADSNVDPAEADVHAA
jgi:hypothetical protein